MPAKHSARPAGPARLILSAAAAVLVLLVVWIAARAVGPAEAARQPWLAPPPAWSAATTPQPSLSTSPSAIGAPTKPTASRSVSRSVSRSASPSRTRKPSPSRTATPASRNNLTASVNVAVSRDQGYMAGVRVQNTGDTSRTWTVTVTHGSLRDLALRNVWNATGRQSGDSFTFTGGPLAPGATVEFGFQATKSGRGDARPTGCAVVGGRCGVS